MAEEVVEWDESSKATSAGLRPPDRTSSGVSLLTRENLQAAGLAPPPKPPAPPPAPAPRFAVGSTVAFAGSSNPWMSRCVVAAVHKDGTYDVLVRGVGVKRGVQVCAADGDMPPATGPPAAWSGQLRLLAAPARPPPAPRPPPPPLWRRLLCCRRRPPRTRRYGLAAAAAVVPPQSG
eukprot:TRINITY_DN48589_c0_g1_i1.p2 TRINITY_DN48589_c0_g1~~TRINITY_DN48589_c0_g1_i1.p2  ORF type:complete len:191 (+),score=101.14 TRINITY_DN48589_c0_g1_i1:44-574(+)